MQPTFGNLLQGMKEGTGMFDVATTMFYAPLMHDKTSDLPDTDCYKGLSMAYGKCCALLSDNALGICMDVVADLDSMRQTLYFSDDVQANQALNEPAMEKIPIEEHIAVVRGKNTKPTEPSITT